MKNDIAAVLDRYGTGRVFWCHFWIPGVKTDKTAKKRRKNEQKARYGLRNKKSAGCFFCLGNRYNEAAYSMGIVLSKLGRKQEAIAGTVPTFD